MKPAKKKKQKELTPSVPIDTDLDANLAVSSYIKDPDWLYKTGMGGMLTAAYGLIAVLDIKHFLYMPLAIALFGVTSGFVLRNIRKQKTEPGGKICEWNQWVDLFMSGLTWLAIQFAILIVAAMMLTAIVAVAILAIKQGKVPKLETGMMALILTLVIVLSTSLMSSYLMVNFASEEKLAAGFACRKVLDAIKKKPKTILTAWMLSCSLQLCSIVLPTLTMIGVFIMPSIFFAAQIISSNVLAQAWRSVEKVEKED